MKVANKLGQLFMSILLVGSLGLACAPTANVPNNLAFYAPMGAPALAIARMIQDKPTLTANNTSYKTSYSIEDASDIASKVITKAADVAILPVTVAAKLLCDEQGNYANKYKVVSVVMHGNLFLLRKRTVESNALKNVAVLNLSAVPGLTYKAILGQNNFTTKLSEACAGKPFLHEVSPVSPPIMISKTEVDAIVAPEPAASAIMQAKGVELGLVKESLQKAPIWGEAQGYAQAVLVVKKKLATVDFVAALHAKVEESMAWVMATENGALIHAEAIESAIKDARASTGIAMTFNKTNLLPDTVQGCSMAVEKGSTIAVSIATYLNAIRVIAPSSPLLNPDIIF